MGGKMQLCSVSLGRRLDYLRLKSGGTSTKIWMAEVEEVHAGVGVDGLETPLDDLCVTLALESGTCITFRLSDAGDRGTFTAGMTLFSVGARGLPERTGPEDSGAP